MTAHFAQPWFLLGLLLVPILLGLELWANHRNRQTRERLGNRSTMAHLWKPTSQLVAIWFGLGLILLIVGAAGPKWGSDSESVVLRGRDVIVIMDLSRSMLARDALPSRWQVARTAVVEMLAAISTRGGHRVGLVGFASKATVLAPLTADLAHIKDRLAWLDERKLPDEFRDPQAVSGTRIGTAIRTALALFDAESSTVSRGYSDIILLSDGDDPVDDAEWRTGVRAARDAAIPVHVAGIGDPAPPIGRWPIPLDSESPQNLRYDGREATTKLYEDRLRDLASETNGIYLTAHTLAPPLARFWREVLAPLGDRERQVENLPSLVPRHSYFLAGALLFWLLATARTWNQVTERYQPR